MRTSRSLSRAFGFLLRAVCVAAGVVLATSSVHAADALQRIKDAGKIVVGTEAALPPFEFIEDGKIVGYGKDILGYLVEDLGVELEQLDLPWQGILPGLDAGKFDLVATAVVITPERVQKYAFTMPISESTHYILKRMGDTSINTVDDLIGKRVGVQLGAIGEISANRLADQWKAAGKGGFSELKLYPSNPEAYLALANGDVDAVIHSLASLGYLIKERPGVYELGPQVSDTAYHAWLTRPEDGDLRDYISSMFTEIRDNGELYKLQDKWFGFRMEIPDSGYLPEGAK